VTAGSETELVATIIDTACGALVADGILPEGFPGFDPSLFAAAQKCIESNFIVPQTTISSIMRRFLFHLAFGARPSHIYAAGSYVGFAFAWMVAGRQAHGTNFIGRGVDIDAVATQTARRNLSHLACGSQVGVEVTDALEDLQRAGPVMDMLFIDIDSPDGRKAAYRDIIEAARPRLGPGALVLAHDALVPIFADDFRRYFDWIEAASSFGATSILPLDECGIAVTVAY
jgi:predicted O-methyltransferase YrrM